MEEAEGEDIQTDGGGGWRDTAKVTSKVSSHKRRQTLAGCPHPPRGDLRHLASGPGMWRP